MTKVQQQNFKAELLKKLESNRSFLPYKSVADRLLENNASVFDVAKQAPARTPSPSTSSAQAASAESEGNQASNDAKGFDAAAKQSQKSTKEMQNQLAVSKAKTASTLSKINGSGQLVTKSVKESEKLAAKIEKTQTELDSLSNNPFGDTYSLKLAGESDNKTDNKTSNGLLGSGGSLLTTQNTQGTQRNQGDQGVQGNQSVPSEENPEITAKQQERDDLIAQKAQADKATKNAVRKAQIAFKMGLSNLKTETNAVNEKKKAAADDMKKANEGKETAGKIVTGAQLLDQTANLMMNAVAPPVIAAGGVLKSTATGLNYAGTGLQVASTFSSDEAQNKSNAADKGLANIDNQRNLLFANYQRAMMRAMKRSC